MTNRDPPASSPAERGWSAGTIAAVTIALIVVLAAISYAVNNSPISTASGPSATTSGQGTGATTAPDRSRASGSTAR